MAIFPTSEAWLKASSEILTEASARPHDQNIKTLNLLTSQLNHFEKNQAEGHAFHLRPICSLPAETQTLCQDITSSMHMVVSPFCKHARNKDVHGQRRSVEKAQAGLTVPAADGPELLLQG